MFSATDKMATVLKPHQLVEMRLGSTEIKYNESQQDTFFKDAKNLISRYVHPDQLWSAINFDQLLPFRCLDEDPFLRCTASEALNHPFFQNHVLMPTTKDMVILPSHILQLYNVFKDEKYKDPKELEGKSARIAFFNQLLLLLLFRRCHT